MGTLWLYAISLDDVRDFFAAPADLSEQLLATAKDVTHEPVKPPLIGKVGPLLRRPITPLIELPTPCMADARAMVEGRALTGDRLGPAWVIVRHWCAIYCRESARVSVDRDQLATLDFAHVAMGLSSQFSFGTVLSRDPHLPLMPAPGLIVGWMPNAHVRRLVGQWGPATRDSSGASPSGSADFSRSDTTGVGLTWPLRDADTSDEWDKEWGVLNGFFAGAGEWATTPTGRRMMAPDVLAMYQ